MEIEINLQEINQFINSVEFHQFLLANSGSFESAAWILQTLLDAVDSAARS